jgi:hypothetical protein
VISYTHIYRLTLALHQPVMVARLMPFGVDGLIVAGSVVLLQSVPGQRWLGWVAVGPGVAISLFANAESGIRYGWLAATWAAIPAVVFSLATFVLERWLAGQAARPVAAPDAVPAAAPADAQSAAVAPLGPPSPPVTPCPGGSSKRGLDSPTWKRPKCANWPPATGAPAGGGEVMGIYVRLLPGVKVRLSKRGVRWAIGSRAARIHVGAGGRSVSTGAGPFSLYRRLVGRRRYLTRL